MRAKREKFSQEYVRDFNGTQAAIRAGYSPKTANEQAARLLANVSIQRRIGTLKASAVKKADITLQKVLNELWIIAFSNIGDFLTFRNNGVKLVDSAMLTRDMLACVSEVSRRGQVVRFKLHDKVKALGTLLQYFVDIPGSGEETRKIIRLPLAIKKSKKSC